MKNQIAGVVLAATLVISACGEGHDGKLADNNIPTPMPSSQTLPTLNAENLPTVPEVSYYELNEVPAALEPNNIKGSIISKMLETNSDVSERNRSSVLYFNVDGEVKPLMCNFTVLKSPSASATIVGLNGNFFVYSSEVLNLNVQGIEEEQHSLAYPKDGSGPFVVTDADFRTIREACMHGGTLVGESSVIHYAPVPEI